MTTKLKWHGQKVIAQTKRQLVMNMGNVTQLARNEVIKSINVSQPVKRLPSGDRVGLDPSSPGAPPKRVHGDLVRSIVSDVQVQGNVVVGSYGSTLKKRAMALEFGNAKGTLKARPFLRPFVLNNRKRIMRLLTRR